MNKKEQHRFNLRINDISVVEQLDKISTEFNLSKNDILNRAINIGLEQVHFSLEHGYQQISDKHTKQKRSSEVLNYDDDLKELKIDNYIKEQALNFIINTLNVMLKSQGIDIPNSYDLLKQPDFIAEIKQTIIKNVNDK